MSSDCEIKYSSKATRVASMLAGEIRDGTYRRGTMLPGVLELAQKFEVAPRTMKKSLAILARSGQVGLLPRRGAVVSVEEPVTTPLPAKTTTISAFWAGVLDHSITGRLSGIQKYARQQGLEFQNQLFSSHDDMLHALENIEEYEIDGALIYPHSGERYLAAMRAIQDKGIPLVSFRRMPGLRINIVESEDPVGEYQAVDYLIKTYNRPVHYVGEPADHEHCHDRYLAYCSAMIDAGYGEDVPSHTWRMDADCADPAYWPTGRKWMPGYQAASRFLEDVTLPISIVAENDYIAQGVHNAVSERGLTIGKDVTLVGMGDLPLASMLSPSLTTLRTCPEKIGQEAARLLHQLIAGDIRGPKEIRLPMELILRESA